MRRTLRIVAGSVSLAVFFLASSPISSQTSVSLRGNVTDPSGAAIPNATVHLISSGTSSDRSITTDQRGTYTFLEVIPGIYRLLVEAPGFEKYEQDDIRFQPDAPAILNVKLKINQIQQNVTVAGQSGEACLTAQARILPDVGPGLRTFRRGPSGNFYVLTNPGAAVVTYSPDGKKIGQIPPEPSPESSIVYGADLQIDSAGRVYVADRGANAIKIYSADGVLVRKIPVFAPVSVEPLEGGEVAVASLKSERLIVVYDTRGKEVRSFGEMSDSGEVSDANRLTNRGWFYGDSSGNLYFNLVSLPDPTVRKYDGYGYAAYTIALPSTDNNGNSNWDRTFRTTIRTAGMGTINSTGAGSTSGATSSSGNQTSSAPEGAEGGMPTIGGRGMGMMRGMGGGGEMLGGGMGGGGYHRPAVEGLGGTVKFTQRPVSPEKPQFNALGVDPATQQVWAAIGGDLIQFDKEGNPAAYYCLSTANQAPVRPTTILVEPDRILIGIDPFGVFEYSRPDKRL